LKKRSLVSLFILLSLINPLFAQNDTGSIAGIVHDDEGKPIPGVTVTARDQQTGIEKRTQTSADGFYYLTSLRPSVYDVTATLEDFGSGSEQNIVVNVGTRVSVNVIVSSRRVEQEVEVVSSAIPETTQSHVGDIVTQNQVESLPLNGRNFIDLAFLVPGNSPAVSFDNTKARFVNVTSAGDQGRGANVIVDGADNNDEEVGGVLQNFSEDGIAEFQVLTSRFSATVGRSGAGAINVITKSGSNDLHGSAFLFYRDDALQKKDPILESGDEEPPFDRQQFGFTSGGPFVKDKAFWFGSFEYTNEDAVTASAFRDVPNAMVRSTLSPTPTNELLLTSRADFKWNDNNNIFGRYSFQGNTILGKGAGFLFNAPTSDPSNFQSAENRIHSGVFGWTRILSNSTINEMRVAEIHFQNEITAQSDSPELFFPSIATGRNSLLPQRTRSNSFQVKDDFTWTSGNHLIQFGGELQRLDNDFLVDFARQGTVLLAEDFASADLNGDGKVDDNDIPVIVALRSNTAAIPFIPNLDNNFIAMYIQDDWHIRNNLTLNLGLRYELDTQSNGANEKNLNERVIFYPDDPGKRERDKKNFGPRLGFAWDVQGNGKTLVRGGYGLYYDRIVLITTGGERLANGKNLSLQLYVDSLLENPFANPVPAAGQVNILSNDLQNPRVQQFNVGFQKQLFEDLNISIDYAGSRGDHFIVNREVNHPRKDVQVNPDINDSVIETTSIAKTSYDGLLFSANKRFSSNLQFQFTYTLARAENWSNDDQSIFLTGAFDIADPSKDQGRAEFVEKHRLVISGIYHAPHNFQISGIFTYASGVPFDIRTNQDFLGDGMADRFPLLPRNAGGREVQTGAELNEWIQLFNSSMDPEIVAMRQTCGCFLPLVDPNLKFTDNFLNLDLRFSKRFTIRNYNLEPMIELFNVFNITNIKGTFRDDFAGYFKNMEEDSFAKPFSTAGGAFGQGGPFAVQLAVRFEF